MKQHQGQLAWREVAWVVKDIGLNDLAEEILSDSKLHYYGVVVDLIPTDANTCTIDFRSMETLFYS